jgi:esterase/lipase superfamily enzyme
MDATFAVHGDTPEITGVSSSWWGPQPSLGSAPATAVVFVHGYNCPIDWACMRLGQLFALGKLSPHLLPIVFSWPCGRVFSYFQVLLELPEVAQDLPRFLAALHEAGIREVHLIAHSMGCELITSAMPQLEALLQRQHDGAGNPGANSGGTGDDIVAERLRLPTVTFLNATCPAAEFLAPEGPLQRLVRCSGRITLYCDGNDFALQSSEILGRRGPSIGRRITPLWPPGGGGNVGNTSIDVVDCTSMDANVSGMRHSYFDLNAHVVADLQELLRTQKPACRRSRLVRTAADPRANVFAFLASPVFVCM